VSSKNPNFGFSCLSDSYHFLEKSGFAFPPIDILSSVCAIVSQEGKLLRVNESMAVMLGFDSSEELKLFCADGIDRIWHEPGDWERTCKEPLDEGLEVQRSPAILQCRDGRDLPCVVSARRVARPGSEDPAIELLFQEDIENNLGFEALVQILRLNRDTMDILPVPLLIHDQGRILFANPAAELFFKSPERCSLEGRQVSQLMDVKNVSQASRDTWTMENRRPLTGEFQVVLANGQARWIRMFGTVTTFLDQPAMLALLYDYTDDRRNEFDLAETERFCQAIVENSPSAILVHDGRVILEANPTAARFFEFEGAEAMAGVRIVDLVHPNSRALFAFRWQNFSVGLTPPTAEISFQMRGGKRKSVRFCSMPVMFKGSAAFVSILHDLTDTRQALERYRNLFATAPLGIAMINLEGGLINPNKRMVELFGYPSSEAMTRDASSEFGQQFFARVADHRRLRRQVFCRGEAHNYMCQSRRLDGSLFWTMINVKVVVDVEGNSVGYKCFVQDITVRKRAEEEAEERDRRIRAISAKLTLDHEQERRRMARDLHDGPAQQLALATMMIEDLADRLGHPGGFDMPLSLLREAAFQLRSNIVDLAPPELFAAGLAEALVRLGRDFKSRHTLAVNVACPDIPNLSREAASFLFRSVRELLMNSVKHGKALFANIEVEIQGRNLVMTVEDDGQGFSMVDSKEHGVGSMGLPDLRGLALDLGGEMSVNSVSGTGTKVILTLPLDALCVEGKSVA